MATIGIDDMTSILGKSVFGTSAERSSYSSLSPVPGQRFIRDAAVAERHFQALLRMIPADGSLVEINRLFPRFTIDVWAELLFGLRAGDMRHLAHARVIEGYVARNVQASHDFHLGSLADFGHSDPPHQVHELLVEYVDSAVDDVLSSALSSAIVPVVEDDPMSAYIRELATTAEDREVLSNQLLSLLLTGRDTVAVLLMNLFFILAREPGVWARLRREIADLKGNAPSYHYLCQSRYLRFCICEGTP